MLVTSIIFLVIGLILFGVSFSFKIQKEDPYGKKTDEIDHGANLIVRWIGIGILALGAVFFFLGSFYTQDVGTAVVEKDITGNVVGQSNSSGWHWKAPWVNTVEFSIRNQPVTFLTPQADSAEGDGYKADGPQITVQDADGVSSNIDVNVRYSIKPSAVTDIYTQYKDEDTFKSAFIFQDIRAVVRAVPNGFSTIDLLTDRTSVEQGITKALEARWAEAGVLVDSISLQEIRPPKSVVESYADAQKAQINVTKEQSNLDAAQVSAQQKVVIAQAEADANTILNGSLTPNILQQRYLDTLGKLAAEGNLVITDGTNSQVLIQR